MEQAPTPIQTVPRKALRPKRLVWGQAEVYEYIEHTCIILSFMLY